MGNPKSKKESIKKVDLNNEVERLMTPEIRKELGISPAFQKFLISYLDIRDSQIVKNLKEQLPVDVKICDNIADRVYDKLAETITPILTRLENLSNGQKDIAKAVDNLKKDTEKNYQEVNNKIIQLKQNIPDEMESQLAKLQKDVTALMRRNNWKAILIRSIITMILAILMVYALLPWYHAKFLENNEGKPRIEIFKK